MDILKKIEDNRFYTIKEIYDNRFFFWYKDYGSVWRTVNNDLKKKNILKAIKIKRPYRDMYKIQGVNIKEYIKAVVEGSN